MNFTADIDRFRILSTAGWLYDFPNGYSPSVINDPSRPFHFEIHCPGVGWQGDITVGLTTEQVHAKLRNIAVLPAANA
ncbi:hypothetical protein ABZ949_02080 [Micromonospora tulbaghiae]|uniref:hypothetical protein n=1 Tax=Micromonospora tulbaghiae TaxID=479978 RepID=UPI0034099D21